jgi:hypothetical protein
MLDERIGDVAPTEISNEFSKFVTCRCLHYVGRELGERSCVSC